MEGESTCLSSPLKKEILLLWNEMSDDAGGLLIPPVVEHHERKAVCFLRLVEDLFSPRLTTVL